MKTTVVTNQKLGSYLILDGLCSEGQVVELRNRARALGLPLLDLVRDVRSIKPDKLMECIAHAYQIRLFKDISSLKVDVEQSKKLDLSVEFKKLSFVVTEFGTEYLYVPDPSDGTRIAERWQRIGKPLPLCMIPEPLAKQLVMKYIHPILISVHAETIESGGINNAAENITDINSFQARSDISGVFNDLIRAAVELRASDIHILPSGEMADVHYRIDGKKRKYTEIRLESLETLRNYMVALAKIPEKGPRVPLEGKARCTYDGREIDIRLNIVRLENGLSDINIRILDNVSLPITELGLAQKMEEQFQHLFEMTKGIVLVVGPTGSGKSTTLYAGVKSSDYQSRNYCTVEDPVEQKMEGITQVSINEEAGATYPVVLKSFLRHDPDVIVVGEIRDYEVAKIAFEASNTGHLVLSTLHTNNALSVIPRLLDIGIRPIAICDSLAAVLAQRLVRKVCPECGKEYFLPAGHPWRKQFELGDGEIQLRKGQGCAMCDHTGYKGRVVIAELLTLSPPLRDAIEKGKSLMEIQEIAQKEGFRPMLEDGIEKALSGVTTFEELKPFLNDIV